MNEAQINELASLFKLRKELCEAIDCARRTDAFREAAEKCFGGSGSNSSIRSLLGGVNDMGTMLKAAAIDRLATSAKEVEAEIVAAGGEL